MCTYGGKGEKTMAQMDARALFCLSPCYNEREALPLTAPVFSAQAWSSFPAASPRRAASFWWPQAPRTAPVRSIRSLHAGDGRFSGLRLGRNRGHQNAVTAGLMWARDKCDITVSNDADLQTTSTP